MSKQVENNSIEMNFARKSTNQEVGDFQIGCDSYIPVTPLKPVLPKTKLIFEQPQETWFPGHGLLFPNSFVHGARAYNAPASHQPPSSALHNSEENLSLSSRLSGFQQGYFSNLLALVNSGAGKDLGNVVRVGNVSGESSSSLSVYEQQMFETNRCEASSSPAKQDVPHGLNLRGNSSWVPDLNLNGNSVPTHPLYDLNSPTTASMEFSGQDIPSHFAPITPDRSRKSECRKAMQGLSLDGHMNQVWDNEGELLNRELQQKNVSCTVESAQFLKNHNSEKTGNLEFDLNKSPKQKPRRKKHRPKVVTEGKPKRTSKPATSKVEEPKENSTSKRKYVRKSKLSQAQHTPQGKATGANADPETASVAERSCKRALNFNLEGELIEERDVSSVSQAQNFFTRVESTSTVRLNDGIEIVLEETGAGLAYDLNRSINKVLKEYILMPESQSIEPQTSNKTNPQRRDLLVNGRNDHARGKCMVFSDDAHDKQRSNTTIKERIKNQSAPESTNSSAEEKQARGLKRRNLQIGEGLNVISSYCNQLNENVAMFTENKHNGNGIPDMHFPAIYKKNRTEKMYCSTISSTAHTANISQNSTNGATEYLHAYVAPHPTEYTSSGAASFMDSRDKELTLNCGLSALQKGKVKKGSKVPNRVCDSFSLTGTIECGRFPPFTSEGAPVIGEVQKYGTANYSPKSIEALTAETNATMEKKKRRLFSTTCTHSGVLKKRPSTVEEITELLVHLNIDDKRKLVRKQQKPEIVPFNFEFVDQNALVLYQRDGTIVPFAGVFDPVRKRKPRPKVDIDEETNRVWRLLLEDINSEGIDGTDGEKGKWWDEQRRMFQGRADSFIARMHLVQGDRRFSPWKGSVLDSVVGVFLTQNVSDHLSSSAFMSLAARFPLHSNNSSRPLDEGTSTVSKEPEVCIRDLEDTINWQGEKSTCISGKEVVKDNESLGTSSSTEISIGNMHSHFLGILGQSIQIDSRTVSDREAIELKEPGISFLREKEINDAPSFHFFDATRKDSVDASVAQTSGRTYPGPSSSSNNNIVPSFMELLQMAGSSRRHYIKRTKMPSYKENKCTAKGETARLESFHILGEERSISNNPRKTKETCASGQSGVTEELVSHIKVQKNVTNLESNQTCRNAQLDVNMMKDIITEHPKDQIQSERESNNIVWITMSTEHKEAESDLKKVTLKSSDSNKPKGKTGKQKQNAINWDSLRVQAQAEGKRRERTANTMDSLDWEAVRCVDVNEIADTIKERGLNNMLAERIQDLLNRLVREHGSTDLEWLRDVPPDKAKEYLLSVKGLGLKSVECVRLLTLHHLAFPVDTNVGRIAVRLGWVPLQPLPEALQLHLLELYPVLESIQRYLWPRLCKLDQRTLYELHYQMITFGKVFCTKSKPNCNACPMRGECRHFASAFASARMALPNLEEKSVVSEMRNTTAYQNPVESVQQLQLPSPQCNQPIQAQSQPQCLPINEVQSTPEPIVEVPGTPEFEEPQQIPDIEDAICEDADEIPMIKLNMDEFTQTVQNYIHWNMELQEGEVSKALVALTPEAASIPIPKLKNVNRLRTEHSVYELPDSHPLLERLNRREPDDPCSYLLAIWTPGETENSIKPPEGKCSSQEFGELCDDRTCFSCNGIREANSQTVRGTLLIPCRTAMRGSFPLNGTYFQVNEVFADHDSSINPIDVPRSWIWNLPRRTVYFGTSIPSIFKGLSTESIQYCFWRGFVCVRGFDQKTRGPRPLLARLHFPASKLPRKQGKPTDKQE